MYISFMMIILKIKFISVNKSQSFVLLYYRFIIKNKDIEPEMLNGPQFRYVSHHRSE